MKRIIVNYDETSGSVTNINGSYIGSLLINDLSIEEHIEQAGPNNLATAISLKFAGFDKEEIEDLIQKGVV